MKTFPPAGRVTSGRQTKSKVFQSEKLSAGGDQPVEKMLMSYSYAALMKISGFLRLYEPSDYRDREWCKARKAAVAKEIRRRENEDKEGLK